MNMVLSLESSLIFLYFGIKSNNFNFHVEFNNPSS